MPWVYKALAITALVSRLIIIYENIDRMRARREDRRQRAHVPIKRAKSKRNKIARF